MLEGPTTYEDFGAGFLVSGAPKTFQNLSVSSPAADATVHPSGLYSYLQKLLRIMTANNARLRTQIQSYDDDTFIYQ